LTRWLLFHGPILHDLKPIIVSTPRRNWPVCGMDFSGSATHRTLPGTTPLRRRLLPHCVPTTGSSMELDAAPPWNTRWVALR